MKKFLGFKETKPKEQDRETNRRGFSMKSVCNILQHFKISDRLKYFPEYRKDIIIDSLVVAYALNDYLVYSNKDLQYFEENGQKKIRVIQHGNKTVIDRVSSFQLLVPYIERKEIDFKKNNHLDNSTTEMQEKIARDFIPGNSITLFIRTLNVHGIPHLDTTVRKRVVLDDGIYATKPLVMLDPVLESFECIDFRRSNRINTNIPCLISLGKNQENHKCLIQDFSERFIRIELPEKSNKALKSMQKETKVFLKVLMDQNDSDLIFKGVIFRIRKNFIVISLENIMKSGRFQPIDQLDEIYIKSTMLSHDETERYSQ